MAVKKGYKQTEAGEIPNDWLAVSIGELLTFQGGSQPDKSFFRQSWKPGYIRLIQIRDYKTDQFITYIPRVLARRFCTTEDIMIGRYGPPIFQILRGIEGAYNVALIKAIVQSKVLQPFCYYFLKRDTLFQFIEKLSQRSSGQTGVDLVELKKYPIPLPPTLAEQEAIAGALSDADGWIESLEQLIAKKRQIKQGAMQELLTGKRRLPGFSGEWETKRLGDCLIGRPQYGINASAVSYSDRLPTYIRITDITEHGKFDSKPQVSVCAPESHLYYLCEGDLVFARTGASVGKSYRYDRKDGDLVFAGFLIRIHPDPTLLNPAYLAGFATTSVYWNWVRLMSMRSGQPGINGNEYSQLPLTLPSVTEQTAIATVLSDMDTEIEALESKLAKAREIKQGMMQELLTGRIRLVG